MKSPSLRNRKASLAEAASEVGILAMRILRALEQFRLPPGARQADVDGRAIAWKHAYDKPRLRCSTITEARYPWLCRVQSAVARRLVDAGLAEYEYSPTYERETTRWIRLTDEGRTWIDAHGASPFSGGK